MKYIDADRLKAEIEQRKQSLRVGICSDDAFTKEQKKEMLVASEEIDRFNRIIDSLQQEQPSEICSKCIHHGKDDGYCYNPHGGMQSLINENGVYECTGFCEQEQPEVDLEKGEQPEIDWESEIEEYWIATGWSKNISLGKFKVIARYFIGLALNATKEK